MKKMFVYFVMVVAILCFGTVAMAGELTINKTEVSAGSAASGGVFVKSGWFSPGAGVAASADLSGATANTDKNSSTVITGSGGIGAAKVYNGSGFATYGGGAQGSASTFSIKTKR